VSATGDVALRAHAVRAEPTDASTPSETAWLALLPCALLTVGAILTLSTPLGRLLEHPGPYALWPTTWWNAQGHPEPHQQGAYVLAMLAALLLAAIVLAGPRLAPRLSRRGRDAIVLAAQLVVVAFVLFAVLGQNDVFLVELPRPAVFGPWSFAAACLLVLIGVAAMRARGRELMTWVAGETRARRAICLAIAGVASAWWLLRAIRTDHLGENIGLFNWTLNDAFAVLDGRTPLVDYRPVYGRLMPYPAALALAAFGKTALVYTLMMALLSALALLAAYAVHRRVTGSSPLALALFVPFAATGAIGETTIMAAMWPMRYGSAYLLAWLTIRHVDGARPRHVATLSFIATLAIVNSSEFGIAALLATVAALACVGRIASRRDVRSLVLQLGGGALAAIAAISALTLARAGELPRLSALTEWPRIFVSLGWFAQAMPTAGLHLAIYATFAAAIVTAAVRVRQGQRDLLTAMLAWSGVFGMIAGSYFIIRSDEVKLYAMLSAWSFALGFLTLAVAGALTARGWRRPSPVELLVLLGFALSVCAIARAPSPGDQLTHFNEGVPLGYRIAMEQFIAERTHAGDTVAILAPEAYRLAYDLRLRNVSPYPLENAIITARQLQTLLDVVRREHVVRIFVPQPGARLTGEGDTPPEHIRAFAAAGYTVHSGEYGILELARE
jgi:hypothetical protein